MATLNIGPFEVQAIGDYIGARYATYANDTRVPSYFLASARSAAHVPEGLMQKAEISLSVTNLADTTGWSTISVGSATNSYSAYPIAPRQFFVTLSAGF